MILGFGSQVLGFLFLVLRFGFDFRFWVVGHRFLDFGFWCLVLSCWVLSFGLVFWFLVLVFKLFQVLGIVFRLMVLGFVSGFGFRCRFRVPGFGLFLVVLGFGRGFGIKIPGFFVF